MVVSQILRVALAILLVAGISCSGCKTPTQDCQDDIGNLIQQCQQYVTIPGPKTDPSPGCCSAIQKADIPCVCKQVPKDVEKFVSMEKVVYVAEKCGKPLPHGFQCGGYIVP